MAVVCPAGVVASSSGRTVGLGVGCRVGRGSYSGVCRGDGVVCAGHRDRGVRVASAVSVALPVSGFQARRGSQSSQGSSQSTQGGSPITYEHHGNWNVGWFLKAVEDIVRRLDGTSASDQFMHTVVGAMDAVILVKRIVRRVDLDAHHISPGGAGPGENRNSLLAMAMAQVEHGDDKRMKTVAGDASASPEQAEVEHVCQELLEASRARLVNSGRVGSCCDAVVGETPASDTDDVSGGVDESLHASYSAGTSAHHHSKAFHGFWGVVVQTKERSSVEGCYLLKAGCSVVSRGCSCTHYTLTRVQEPSSGALGVRGEMHPGEYVPSVADQFVESWRQRRGRYDV